jgi:nucleoside-diphosphate-sugar epimerase
MQFVQEDDLVELMLKLISKPVEGTYNVANDGEIRYNEIAKLAGKRMIVLPERLVRPLLSFSWSLRLQTKSPPVGLGFIKYPPLVSTRSLKKNIQYSFRYSTREAIISYLKK